MRFKQYTFVCDRSIIKGKSLGEHSGFSAVPTSSGAIILKFTLRNLHACATSSVSSVSISQ